jgi:signal peptidase I
VSTRGEKGSAPSWWRTWLELPFLLVAALALALLLKGTTAQAFSIPSESMVPTLEVGDRVLVSRLSYRLHDPNRGDIVVFPSPIATADTDPWPVGLWHDALETVALRDAGDDELIKRVVGLPGETIEARNGHVIIDGRVLIEPYLPAGVTTIDFGPVRIPDGHVFMMGDNRGNSHDSRYSDIGPIDEDTIVGRAIARIWPPTRTGFL